MKKTDVDKIKAIIKDKKTDASTRRALVKALPREDRTPDLYLVERVVSGRRLAFLDSESADEYERRAGK